MAAQRKKQICFYLFRHKGQNLHTTKSTCPKSPASFKCRTEYGSLRYGAITCAPVLASAFTTDLARKPVEPNTVTIWPLKLDLPPVPRRFLSTSTLGNTSVLITRGKKSAFRSVGTFDSDRTGLEANRSTITTNYWPHFDTYIAVELGHSFSIGHSSWLFDSRNNSKSWA